MAIYTEYEYISCASSLADKIAKIDSIIAALEDTALKAASKGFVDEYELDDGQTKIRTSYRSPKAIYDAIKAYEQQRQYYLNKCTGRVIALRDAGSNNPTTNNGRGF